MRIVAGIAADVASMTARESEHGWANGQVTPLAEPLDDA
jgi:hypothetical protein